MGIKKKHFWMSVAAIITVAAFLVWYFVVAFAAEEEAGVQEEQVTHIDIPFHADGMVSIHQAGPQGTVLYNGNIEIAATEQKREQGLMYRDSLAADNGMLFVFPEEEYQAFWMRNTRMPLDIIYIASSGTIVSIAENARPYDETSLPSEGPAQFVLEIKGGLCAELGIKAGDFVTWTSAD